MTRGDEDIEKGGSENLYTSKPTGEGRLLKIEPLVSSRFKFQYLHCPPLVILNERSLRQSKIFNKGLSSLYPFLRGWLFNSG